VHSTGKSHAVSVLGFSMHFKFNKTNGFWHSKRFEVCFNVCCKNGAVFNGM
jgi:hypothetical protein